MKSRLLVLVMVLAGIMAQAAEVPGIFWGNVTGVWEKALAGVVTVKRSNTPTPEVPVFPETRVMVMSYVAKYNGAKYTPEQVEALRKYVSQGGVVIMYGAVPTCLFGKNTFDISAGMPVLGAGAYGYGTPKSNVSETAKKFFGADVVNPYATAGRRPHLGKVSAMTILFGEGKNLDLGILRIGKGAVIYSSERPSAAAYAELIKKLVMTVLDEKAFDAILPLPENNQGAMINGQLKHLAVAGSGAPATFLTEKLTAILKKKA